MQWAEPQVKEATKPKQTPERQQVKWLTEGTKVPTKGQSSANKNKN